MQVELQFFSILDVTLNLDSSGEGGGADWTKAPPATVTGRNPSFAKATIPDNGSVYVTYAPASGQQGDLGAIVSGKNGAITARGESQNPAYKVSAVVSGSGGNFIVAVNFKT